MRTARAAGLDVCRLNRILWFTVQRNGRNVKDARRYVPQFHEYMRQQAPEYACDILKIEGACIHYRLRV